MSDVETQIQNIRDQFYQSLGTVAKDVFAVQMAMSYPKGHKALIPIQNGSVQFVVSEGLSDSNENLPTGFSSEVLMATAEPLSDVMRSWLTQAVGEMADQLAADIYREDVRDLVEEIGPVSCELASVRGLPEEYITPQGRVGVLLGIKSKSVPTYLEFPNGKIRILIMRLLKANELMDIITKGENGRKNLVQKFEAEANPHCENLTRASYSETVIAKPDPTAAPQRAQLPEPQGTPSAVLALQGVSPAASKEELETLFKTYGNVVKVSRIPGVLCTVMFDSVESATSAAKNLNGIFVQGQPITIGYAKMVAR